MLRGVSGIPEGGSCKRNHIVASIWKWPLHFCLTGINLAPDSFEHNASTAFRKRFRILSFVAELSQGVTTLPDWDLWWIFLGFAVGFVVGFVVGLCGKRGWLVGAFSDIMGGKVSSGGCRKVPEAAGGPSCREKGRRC